MISIGLFGITMGPCAAVEASARAAGLAERLGYDSVWAPEHAVLPAPRPTNSPLDPSYPILDPLVTLAHVAALTTRIKLATGVVLIPQHHPVVLSKQLVTLDLLSAGRLMFGVGVGYLDGELRAAGVPMGERGSRADEYLRALQSLWADERPHCSGAHVTIVDVDAHPRPASGRIPVVVGGQAPAAHRRAVRFGAGWYGFRLDRAAVAAQVESLRRAAEAVGRDLAGLEISVTPVEPLTDQIVADYAGLGVDRLVVAPPRGPFWRTGWSYTDYEDFIRRNAPAQLGASGPPAADGIRDSP